MRVLLMSSPGTSNQACSASVAAIVGAKDVWKYGVAMPDQPRPLSMVR